MTALCLQTWSDNNNSPLKSFKTENMREPDFWITCTWFTFKFVRLLVLCKALNQTASLIECFTWVLFSIWIDKMLWNVSLLFYYKQINLKIIQSWIFNCTQTTTLLQLILLMHVTNMFQALFDSLQIAQQIDDYFGILFSI
jgi:hypothetical protein